MNKNNTILIVDDCKENIDALRVTLEDDHKIKVAVNGEMALRALSKGDIDLVLLDVVMPEMDGFEVLSRMRDDEKNKNIPVIFITGEMDAYSEAKGLLLGAVDYVTKPYNADIISIKVSNQLENKMYRDKLEQLVAERTKQLTDSRDALIMGMSLIAESRDTETGAHIKRMQAMSTKLAQKFMEMYPDVIGADEMKRISLVSPLHDVGKVRISDNILLKPGKLTDEEFHIIKQHTVYGAELLEETLAIVSGDARELKTAIEIAASHHEKFDGSGYPYGLVGEKIPISARIVAVADVFDALVSIRAYKKALTLQDAYDIILKGDGRTMPQHFDPRLLTVFDCIKEDLAACAGI